MEEELSGGCHQFPKEFDRERILELISNVKYSETMIENCLKMLHYLPKLIVNSYFVKSYWNYCCDFRSSFSGLLHVLSPSLSCQ